METSPEEDHSSQIKLPPQSWIENREGNEMLIRGREEFYLSHRRFNEINAYFSGMISQQIADLLERTTDRPVQILDIGGGVGSEAVRDIQQRYGNRVRAINADIAHDKSLGTGADRVQAEVQHLPFASGKFDIAYSLQLFPFLRRFEKDHYIQVFQGLTEIARVLSPGGIAFINDEEELSGTGERREKTREHLEQELGVVFEVKNSAIVKSGRDFPRVWKKQDRPEKFLMMQKPIVDPNG